MHWEKRLREMLLAGGALAAAACSSTTSSSGATGSDAGNPGSDASSDAVANDVTLGGGDASGCCNAAPDPCCEYLYCEASITPTCSAEMACEAEGGIWSYSGCSTSQDAGPGDAASADADASAAGD